MNRSHPLEQLLNADANDIMSAIQGGFRTIVDVKGKLAEYFVAKELQRQVEKGVIQSFEWHDSDGRPDFSIATPSGVLRLECKNVRSGEVGRKYQPGYVVEIQRTRNSKDGTPSRGYLDTHFDILAACLFNQTGKWEYLFIPANALAKRPRERGGEGYLEVMQRVHTDPGSPWSPTLRDAIAAVRIQSR